MKNSVHKAGNPKNTAVGDGLDVQKLWARPFGTQFSVSVLKRKMLVFYLL